MLLPRTFVCWGGRRHDQGPGTYRDQGHPGGAHGRRNDPIDAFGQWFVTKGGRWYQRHSLPELDKLFAQQKFIADPEARKKVIWEMDTLAMNDAAYLILHWFDLHHVRWNFVKGWTITPNIRSTNARMDYVWLDLKEFPHTR